MTTIDYATRKRQHGWLRRNLKRVVVVAICAAVGILVHRNWRRIERYVRWHYWHWQLAQYEMSPRDAIASPTTVPTSATAGTRHAARPLAELDWSESAFGSGMPYTPIGSRGFYYVGQRRRPDGASRTVVIEPRGQPNSPFSLTTFRVIREPGWFKVPPSSDFFCRGTSSGISNPFPSLVECNDDPADSSAIFVTFHPIVPLDGQALPPRRMRARLTDGDWLDWTLE